MRCREEGAPNHCLRRRWLPHARLLAVAFTVAAFFGWGCPASAFAQTAGDDAARQAMRQGSEAMAAGNFDAAVAAYTQVTQSMPDYAEGYFNLGLAMQQAGKLDDARAALEHALRLKPGLRGANLFLGVVLYRQNHFKDAETYLLRETHIDPRGAKAYMWLGVCRLAQDDPQGAIAPLDKALALDPSDVDILYHRGRAYFLVANASYDAMFKLDRDSMRVHQVLAEANAQAYHTQEAISEFELAIKMAPTQPGLHEELADQYWIAGQLDKIASTYREELSIDPHAVSAMYKVGSFLVRTGDPEQGIAFLRSALREDASFVDAHYYLADGLAATDHDQEAIHEFELAIKADPSNDRAMSAYYKLSQEYRKLHQTPEAQTALANYQQLKAQLKVRQDQKTAQIVRKRTELPVDDPERASISAEN
jgi:tetratricopeptide (TPR) repeat protein